MISAHGFTAEEIPISMHGFDPIEPQNAKTLIKKFSVLGRSFPTIKSGQDTFYLDTSILNTLLTETRNFAQFDVLDFVFGVDKSGHIVLLVTRSKGERDMDGDEVYHKVPQLVVIPTSGAPSFKIIEYAILLTEDGSNNSLKILDLTKANIDSPVLFYVDVNDSDYSLLRKTFDDTFESSNPEVQVIVPPKLNFLKTNGIKATLDPNVFLISTHVIGYRLGKDILRQIWQQDGAGAGIKLFLGYGPSTKLSSSPKNLHLIAVGTNDPDFQLSDKYTGKIWATVDGTDSHLPGSKIDGSSTCVRTVNNGGKG